MDSTTCNVRGPACPLRARDRITNAGEAGQEMKYTLTPTLGEDYLPKVSVVSHSIRATERDVDFETIKLEVHGYIEVAPGGLLLYVPDKDKQIYAITPLEEKYKRSIAVYRSIIRKLKAEMAELKGAKHGSLS